MLSTSSLASCNRKLHLAFLLLLFLLTLTRHCNLGFNAGGVSFTSSQQLQSLERYVATKRTGGQRNYHAMNVATTGSSKATCCSRCCVTAGKDKRRSICRCAMSSSFSSDDGVIAAEEGKNDGDEAEEEMARRKGLSVNERLLAEINAERASLKNLPSADDEPDVKETDLNGLNPAMVFLGAAGAGGMSWGAWKATTFLVMAYAQQHFESDIYFITRLSGIMKQVIVGLGSLAAGIFGVTAVGITLLGFKVLVGVVNGELDMNADVDLAAEDRRGRKKTTTSAAPTIDDDPSSSIDIMSLLATAEKNVEEQLKRKDI